jgi:hypothetical protein
MTSIDVIRKIVVLHERLSAMEFSDRSFDDETERVHLEIIMEDNCVEWLRILLDEINEKDATLEELCEIREAYEMSLDDGD